MTYGFPCQDISALGLQSGFYSENGELTRSGLFFKAFNIAKIKKPSILIAENVRALISSKMIKNFTQMISSLDSIGYNSYFKVLNSKDYGIPQSRNRIYIISIRKDIDDGSFTFPDKEKPLLKACDFYEQDRNKINEDLYITDYQKEKYANEFRIKKKYSSLNSDTLVCMTTKQGSKSNPQNFIQDEKGTRILTSGELFSLQGFKKSDGYMLEKNGFSMSKIGFMVGNSITVPVLERILHNLYNKNK